MSGNRTGERLRRLTAMIAVVLAAVVFSLPNAGLLHSPHVAMHHSSVQDPAVAGTTAGETSVTGYIGDIPCCPAMGGGHGIDCATVCMAVPGAPAQAQSTRPPAAAERLVLQQPLRLVAHAPAPDHGPPRG